MFQGDGVFDEDAAFCRNTRADQQRRWCGKAECTGACYDQHRHSVQQGLFPVAVQSPPASECGERDDQHHRYEDAADTVNEALNGRFASLCVLHQTNNPREGGLGADGSGAQCQHSIDVDGAAYQGISRRLGTWQAFAGDQRSVEMALPLGDDTVHGYAVARQEQYQIAYLHCFHGHFGGHAVVQHSGSRRPQRMQRPNSGRGLVFGALLQPLAEQHQCNDGSRGFEVKVLVCGDSAQGVGGCVIRGCRAQPQVDRKPIGRGSAERYQQVHVAGTCAQCGPAGTVKPRAQPKLHRGSQSPLPTGRQHPVQAEGRKQHRHD